MLSIGNERAVSTDGIVYLPPMKQADYNYIRGYSQERKSIKLKTS